MLILHSNISTQSLLWERASDIPYDTQSTAPLLGAKIMFGVCHVCLSSPRVLASRADCLQRLAVIPVTWIRLRFADEFRRSVFGHSSLPLGAAIAELRRSRPAEQWCADAPLFIVPTV
jgi:hypothetical protein